MFETGSPEGDSGALYRRGASQWPGLELSAEMFSASLRDADAVTNAEGDRAGDLYLAFAVARTVPGALEAFDTRFRLDLQETHGRFGSLDLSFDEFRQQLYERLCVGGTDRKPAISQFRGRGSLRAWLRVAAVRFLTDRYRAQKVAPVADCEVDQLAALSVNPEIAYLRRRFLGVVKPALEAALAGLEPRERALLRQRYVHGLQVHELAKLHNMHRVTASRTLKRVHEDLLSRVRRNLVRELGFDDAKSAMEVVGSELELSLSRLLATESVSLADRP